MAKTLNEIDNIVSNLTKKLVIANLRHPIGSPADILDTLLTYSDDFLNEWDEFCDNQGWIDHIPLDDPTFKEVLNSIERAQELAADLPPRSVTCSRIRQLMIEQNVAIKDLAQKTGYSEATLSQIIDDKCSVGIDVFMTILDALGMDISFIEK